ncbi:conjugal transfer protein TraF [Sphaerotilus mobilis]|uniref:F plasmid transfer operon protein TraF n=1 Tax=Sphaerotilus mobilis TaxID=47994 RepID=A0A4Q7LBH0_9BURK|nr:conjugal transfer protein TraF [Sphaerotilus mobilis]RZS47426.1 F plasmid transfer operon protein TraF [Sphaerotilus mobilis]
MTRTFDPLAAAALALCATGLPAQANQSLFTPGYGLTVGPVFNRNNLSSAGYNPANAVRLVDADESVRFGLMQAGAQYTLGEIDDLQKQLDAMDAAVQAARDQPLTAQARVDQINTLLPNLEKGARIHLAAGGSLLTPLLIRSVRLGGVFSVVANAQVQVAGQFLGRDAELAVDAGNQTVGLKTRSGFDVRVARLTQLALGYGTELTRRLDINANRGQLDAGLRLNVYQAKLYRQVVGFTDENGNGNSGSGGSTFSQDSVDSRSASAVGVDLGVAWTATNYQLGATLYNIGQPTFRYPDPLQDTSAVNRYAAAGLSAEQANAQVALKTHLVLEGSLYSDNKRWLGQTSLALNETPDVVGEPQRLASLSLSYNAERFEGSFGTLLNYIVPSVRLGLRKNLAGSRLGSTGLGFSWGIVNLDFHQSQQKVSADGGSVPRSAGASLSVTEKF